MTKHDFHVGGHYSNDNGDYGVIEINEQNHFMVETGEDSALSSLRVDSLVKERRAYGIEFISSPSI